MRSKSGVALVVVLAAVAAACQPAGPAGVQLLPPGIKVDLAPRVANRPTGGDAALIERVPAVHLLPTWTTPLLDRPNGHPIDPGGASSMGNGLALAVIDGSAVSGDGTWYRAFALSNQQSGPADYFGWIQADPGGTGSVSMGSPTTCPTGDSTMVDLRQLDPFTRVHCLGAASFELEGFTSWMSLPVWYDVQPPWFGKPQDGTSVPYFSLQAGPVVSAYSDDPTSLDLQLPPGLGLPPFGFKIAVRAHVADREGDSCRRSADASLGLPTETADDSAVWCATRLVVEQWTPLLGPEGRAIDPHAPQLHRHPAAPNGMVACAGVGMPMLTFHVDPSALDPVWLQADGFSGHIIASFDPSFRAAYAPDLVVLDGSGRIVARDGTRLNPDSTISGHAVCPMGSVVAID